MGSSRGRGMSAGTLAEELEGAVRISTRRGETRTPVAKHNVQQRDAGFNFPVLNARLHHGATLARYQFSRLLLERSTRTVSAFADSPPPAGNYIFRREPAGARGRTPMATRRRAAPRTMLYRAGRVFRNLRGSIYDSV